MAGVDCHVPELGLSNALSLDSIMALPVVRGLAHPRRLREQVYTANRRPQQAAGSEELT